MASYVLSYASLAVWLVGALTGCAEESGAPPLNGGCADQIPKATTSSAEREASEPRLLWSYEKDTPGPVYESVALGSRGRHVLTGTFDGEARMFALANAGQSRWAVTDKAQFYVAAASGEDAFYSMLRSWGLGEAEDGEVSLVQRFRAASPTPIWTYDASADGFRHPYYWGIPQTTLMATSPDGELLAVASSMDDTIAILFFEADSPEPIAIYRADELAHNHGAPWLRFGANGEKLFYRLGGKIHQVDPRSGELDWSRAPLGNSYYIVSPDGSLLVIPAGQSIFVEQWNGEGYESAWRYWLGAPEYEDIGDPRAVAILGDNRTIVAVWPHKSNQQITVTSVSLNCDPPDWTVTRLWSYTTPKGNGPYQDIPSALAVSDDGRWVAVGTWGTGDDAHPEFMLFDTTDPKEPRFVIDTPGSVLAIDMTPDGSTIVVGTKAVHANVVSNGGGVYAVSTKPEAD